MNSEMEGERGWLGPEEHEGDRHSQEGATKRVVEQSRRVREDVQELVSAPFDARSEVEQSLRERLTAHPYLGLAAAAGVGYVLGAGVSLGLLRSAVGLGSRVALAVVMRRLAGPITEMITDGAS